MKQTIYSPKNRIVHQVASIAEPRCINLNVDEMVQLVHMQLLSLMRSGDEKTFHLDYDSIALKHTNDYDKNNLIAQGRLHTEDSQTNEQELARNVRRWNMEELCTVRDVLNNV